VSDGELQPWLSISDAHDYGGRLFVHGAIRLRELRDEDLPQLVSWWRDPSSAALQAGMVRLRPTATVEDQFRSWSSNKDFSAVGYSICRSDDGALLGHATLYGAGLPDRCATLAIIIGGPFVGQGYGTSAVRAMVDYGFAAMGLHRIELTAWAFNDRALASYRSAGFVEEGRRRNAVLHDGMFHDQVLMSVLEDEWRTNRMRHQ
jgi:RimJ/RimL family protein N-acetyltransferase